MTVKTFTKKMVDSEFVENSLEGIIGLNVSSWYRVTGSLINVHLGNSNSEEGKDTQSFDYSLYLNGDWEILKSGKEILTDSNDLKSIDNFIENNYLGKTVSVKLFHDSLDLFIEFEEGITLHVLPPIKLGTTFGWLSLGKFGEYSLHLHDPENNAFIKTQMSLK